MMKLDVLLSVLITKDEHKELIKYISKYMIETGEQLKTSPMIRQLLLDHIRGKNPIADNPDNKIDKEVRDRWYYWWQNNYSQ